MALRPEPTAVAAEERLERLLRMVASLEEAIALLELNTEARASETTILRLRVIQGEILRVLHDLRGDSPLVV
jgi:hypothetical protein